VPKLPTVVVLCAGDPGADHAAAHPPAQLERISGRVHIRATDADGLAEALPGAQVLFLWDFFSTAVADVWDQCADLEWIHVAAAGVDTLLFPGLRESAITVTNARGVFDRPIAEFVLACVLAHAKDLLGSRQLQQAGAWRHRETRRVEGSRALVVGTGAIGREIARLLGSVGMQVRAAGRTPSQTDPDFGTVVPSAALPDHVGWADYVVNATPLTAATRGLFDAEVFAAMQPSAHFVNVGRGPTVVETDLMAALEQRLFDSASLDVFETEPLPADSPIWRSPYVVVSAHMSGDVVGWRDALADQFVDNAMRWLDGRPLHNVVDKKLGYVRERR